MAEETTVRRTMPLLTTVLLLGLGVASAGCTLPGGSDNVLRFGTLMPATGDLAVYGVDGQRAVDLAVKHLNEADLEIRFEVAGHEDDRSSDTAAASAAFDRLINRGAEVIIGSYSSALTASVMDKMVEAEVVMITPASTAAGLTLDRENQGWFFRIPPSDDKQAKIMADLLNEDGHQTVNVLAINNDYGVGFGNSLERYFDGLGITMGRYVKYNPSATSFTSEVQEAAQGDPDAIVLVAYVETGASIMREAHAQGVTGNTPFYFSEGVYSASFTDKAGTGSGGDSIVAGFKGTTPESLDAPGAQAFKDAFQAEYGKQPELFAAEAYDATLYAGLASVKAGSARPAEVRDNIRDVANAPGDAFSDPAAALAALSEGTSINYGGAAHDFDFDDRGDPAEGIYAIWQVQANGTLTITQSGLRP